jgi:rhodanese-related sulfurtransferase
MSKHFRLLLSLMLALSIFVSACGGDEEPTPAPQQAAPLAAVEQAAPTPTPEPTPAPVAEPTQAPAEEVAEVAEPAEVSDTHAAVDAYLAAIPEGFMMVSLDAFKQAMDATDVYVIDVREVSDYEAGHIEGAVNIPIRTLVDDLSLIPTDQPVIIYCASGLRAGMATSVLRTMGYDNVRSYAGGWRAWSAANEPVSTDATEPGEFDVPQVDAQLTETAQQFLNNLPEGFHSISSVERLEEIMDSSDIYLIDVREDNEVAETGMIPGAVHIPLRTLAQQVAQIPADQPVVVYCKSGFRAALASGALHMMGFENVRAFPPSFDGWAAADKAAAEEPAIETGAVEGAAVVAAVDAYLTAIPEGFMMVSLDALKSQMDATDVYVIDIREESDYEAGHIEGAVNIPIRTLAENLNQIPSDRPVVIYCASGLRAGLSLSVLRSLGYDNIRAYAGGWRGWSAAGEPAGTEAVEPGEFDVPELDEAVLAAANSFLANIPDGFYGITSVDRLNEIMDASEIFLVDVREDDEVAETGMIPGAVHIPLRTVAQNLDQIPADQPVVVYCKVGFRSALAAGALHHMGYTNVRVFTPSMSGWLEADGEVAR